jgi:hypothetical protein
MKEILKRRLHKESVSGLDKNLKQEKEEITDSLA